MNGLFPCCSDALITRVVLIFTTAGEAFSIMSANELDSWLTRWVFVSARAVTDTGALVCDATAKAAIKPPPIEAATSPSRAVLRRNWTTFGMYFKILSCLLSLDVLISISIYSEYFLIISGNQRRPVFGRFAE